MNAVFPDLDEDQNRFLELFSRLIHFLKLGDDACAAWNVLSEWAAANRQFWQVQRPDTDRVFEIFQEPPARRK